MHTTKQKVRLFLLREGEESIQSVNSCQYRIRGESTYRVTALKKCSTA